jgi:hypothetical protein
MNNVARAVVAAIVAAVAIVVPAVPASAAPFSGCTSDEGFRVCVQLQRSYIGNYRGIASIEDKTSGDDIVAVMVFVEVNVGAGWKVLSPPGPRVELNDYALTATVWYPCINGSWMVRANYNYRNGQVRGKFWGLPYPISC